MGTNLGIITTDITERKQIEQQFLKTKRFVNIGETAGVVDHDLRNPLQAIVNTIYLANMILNTLPYGVEKDELKNYLDTVERQVGNINMIVSDLLDYARPIHPELTLTNILQLIQSTLLAIEIPEIMEVFSVITKKMKKKLIPR